MKKIVLFSVLFLAFVLTACNGSQNKPGTEKAAETTIEFTTAAPQSENPAESVSGEPVTSPAEEIPADLSELTGRYLNSRSGDGILVIDDYGPVGFTYQSDDKSVLDTLEDGDIITVKAGPIQETWPGYTTVYACTLAEKGRKEDIDPAMLAQLMEMGQIEEAPLIRMLYTRDMLFYDTGRKAHPTCGTEDGRFTSVIASSKIPSENYQANFGSTEDGYIFLWEGALAVRTGESYSLFLADGTVEFEGSFFKESELSSNTLAWLENYNKLPEEERLRMSYVPFELLPEMGPDADSDANPGAKSDAASSVPSDIVKETDSPS